jgi:hypothetical protein
VRGLFLATARALSRVANLHVTSTIPAKASNFKSQAPNIERYNAASSSSPVRMRTA